MIKNSLLQSEIPPIFFVDCPSVKFFHEIGEIRAFFRSNGSHFDVGVPSELMRCMPFSRVGFSLAIERLFANFDKILNYSNLMYFSHLRWLEIGYLAGITKKLFVEASLL